MINKMLSSEWVTSYYPVLYNGTALTVSELGFPYRIAESNSFSGYLRGGSNSFATALFILDYMHWWAEHGAAGINIHNKQWVGNGPIYLDKNMSFQIYPVGYGIAAFNTGGHGRIDSLSITNQDSLNLTAYAVADTNALFVTIINKEHGAVKRYANINIKSDGYLDSAKVMYLNVPDGNAADTAGVLLGGAAITNTGWSGKWTDIDSVNSKGYFLKVPASSAAIVMISGTVTSLKERSESPFSFKLFQNYPNPFNPTTVITYSIPKSGYTSLKVYNILGQEIADIYKGFQKVGTYKFNFDGTGLSSGIYLYRLQSNDVVLNRKMLLLK